jgi:hypothetical protein
MAKGTPLSAMDKFKNESLEQSSVGFIASQVAVA